MDYTPYWKWLKELEKSKTDKKTDVQKRKGDRLKALAHLESKLTKPISENAHKNLEAIEKLFNMEW